MEISNVSFAYDQQTMQLHSISTSIPKHKITTIIGPNGCGKSTLLSLMSRGAEPAKGTIRLEQKDVLEYKPKEFAQKVAIVYQQNEAPKDLTVEKLIQFGRLPHRSLLRKDRAKDEEAIEWALNCTKLIDMRHKSLDALSGGERQRVWIAMALAQQSDVLFLDEPTTYLDIYYQLEILELVKELNEKYGLTIVMVLHDINQAIRYSHHLIVMKDGRKMIEGEPEKIIDEELIKSIYGVEAIVIKDKRSGLYMVPMGI